jgi:hypothetical protein
MTVRKEKPEEDYGVLLEFLENLKKSEGTKIGWKEILLRLCEEEGVDEGVKVAIEDCIQEIEGSK